MQKTIRFPKGTKIAISSNAPIHHNRFGYIERYGTGLSSGIVFVRAPENSDCGYKNIFCVNHKDVILVESMEEKRY